MTIINGYKIVCKDAHSLDHYSYVTSSDMDLVNERIAKLGWSNVSILPTQFAKASCHDLPVAINWENEIQTLYHLFAKARIIVSDNRNRATKIANNSKYLWFGSLVESGKNYLVGKEMSMLEFLSKFTSSCSDWQIIAHHWAVNHPDQMLIIETKNFCWDVAFMGDCVTFDLPHHDKGGEVGYVSHINTPKRKVKINVD